MADITAGMILRRFAIPQLVANLYLSLKFRCFISPRAEVELSRNVQLGKGVVISSFVKIKASGRLTVGKETGLASFCFVSASGKGIVIGNQCIFGPGVTVTSSNYLYEDFQIPFIKQGQSSKGVRIGNNVWIGAGTTIVDGTTIEDNTIVVANSLLNRRYPPNCILQGNPAKVILKRSSSGSVDDLSCDSGS